MSQKRARAIILTMAASGAMGAVLARLQPDPGWGAFAGFFAISFLALTALASATLWAGGGTALAWMVSLAFLLRLVTGVGLHVALPTAGYDDPDDRAGYVYTDAHRRDTQAWELANSNKSLLDAFARRYHADQYGGLLAFSALAYRLFSPGAHRPLLLVLLTALTSALGVPFLWRATGALWNKVAARASCWLYVLYPEFVLLGGSAMREPYLIALSAQALWGLALMLRPRPARDPMPRAGVLWMAASALLMLLVSPAALLANLVVLLGWYLVQVRRSRAVWPMVAGGVALLIAGGLFLSWSLNRRGQFGVGAPPEVVGTFLRQAVAWDVYQLERGSGWVQKLFEEMPHWLHLPFVATYGVLQPVLPAALIEPTTPLWQAIAIGRAAGWYLILPLLALSLFLASRWAPATSRNPLPWLSWACWIWIVLAALRGGADQWDNPRYRSILFVWQAVLVAQAWTWWQATRSPWLGRAVAMELALVLGFGQWYLSRYLHVGAQVPFGLVVAGIAALWVAILTGGWLWDRHRLTRQAASL